jgi:hypothetical protein
LPQTAVYFDHTEPWGDGWAGPRLLLSRDAGPGARLLRLRGWTELKYLGRPLKLAVSVDGQPIAQPPIERNGEFSLDLPLARPLSAGPHTIEVKASAWFVPHHFSGVGDYRPLAWKLIDIELRS